MGLHLHSLFLLAIMHSFVSKSISTPPDYPIAKPNCADRCGNLTIPFPFGLTDDCSYNRSFLVTCNHTDHYNSTVAFWVQSDINITDISLEGQMRILHFIAKACYSQNGTIVSDNNPMLTVPRGFTVNNIVNKFIAIGCDTYGLVNGSYIYGGEYETGCRSFCNSEDDLADLTCTGIGCCKTSIPKHVWEVNLTATSYNNFRRSYGDDHQTTVWNFSNCSYGMLVEDKTFTFSTSLLSSLMNVEMLPMVVDWAVGEGTCKEAQKNESSYACKSNHSKCTEDPENGIGYRCYCEMGYAGNPYLFGGCIDIDECHHEDLNICEYKHLCRNKWGNFTCDCPKGNSGDGNKYNRVCTRNISHSLVFKLVAGIASGVTVLVLVACCLYLEVKRRKWITMKRNFFLQNGGLLLQEKLIRRDTTKLFTSAELTKATDNFHASRIVGRGGFGTVYKGFLQDNRIVAVKKSKEVDPNQVEQFINEVIVLSQINHRNVVKLLGCCLETQVPLLVYEFINNGTLFEHINNKTKASNLTWEKRLTIAAESAGVLAYLHSVASPPIIHRDVKSANILLDANFTAKVSDFGASRLVPMDQTQLSTMVQGTFGYLDPEYMQTNQLTEKSDVYSFGVVLVELLTGLKALSYDRPEDEINLACYFLVTLKQGHLFNILDGNIIREGNNQELILVAMLAERCLQVKRDDRPSMKEVGTELEGVRATEKHSWTQTEPDAEEMEVLPSIEMNTFPNFESASTCIGYGVDSMRDHILPPIGGAR